MAGYILRQVFWCWRLSVRRLLSLLHCVWLSHEYEGHIKGLPICFREVQVKNDFADNKQRKGLVWQTIWKLEDSDCAILYKDPNPNITLYNVMDGTYYLVW